MTQMLWLVAALVLLPCGWFAAAQFDNRWLVKLPAPADLTALEITRVLYVVPSQAPPIELRDAAATDPAPSGARAEAGFASTVARSDGFPQTVLVRPPPKRR